MRETQVTHMCNTRKTVSCARFLMSCARYFLHEKKVSSDTLFFAIFNYSCPDILLCPAMDLVTILEDDIITIMKELELTAKKLENIRKTIYEQNCISIHKPVAGTEDAVLEDILADDADIAAEVEDQVFQDEIKKVVNDAVDQLPSKHSQVIHARYLEDATQIQVAEDMNISNQRVSQIEKEALFKLGKMQRLQELHDELYGYDSQYAYTMSLKTALDHNTSSTEHLALKRLEYEEKHKKKHEELDEVFAELLEG